MFSMLINIRKIRNRKSNCAITSHRLSKATVYRKNTMIYDRIWKKYDRLRFPYFVVYDSVYDRLRPYTESVIVDLG